MKTQKWCVQETLLVVEHFVFQFFHAKCFPSGPLGLNTHSLVLRYPYVNLWYIFSKGLPNLQSDAMG